MNVNQWQTSLMHCPLSSENERAKAIELLKRHESVFSRGEFDVGRTDLICHRINTGSHAQVRQPLRRHPTAYLETIDDYIDQLQANDIIEPSSGPWAANVVCVKRKDGRLRLCCDFRGVNARTYHDSWPLPNIEATFDTLTGCRFFSSCDLCAGYHNIPVHEDDRDKTQIITRRGTWRLEVDALRVEYKSFHVPTFDGLGILRANLPECPHIFGRYPGLRSNF